VFDPKTWLTLPFGGVDEEKNRSSLSIVVAMTIMFIHYPQVVRAASPEGPSCDSFGIQRNPGKKEAPAFSLKDLNGKQVSLSDFKGKPLLVVFWATW